MTDIWDRSIVVVKDKKDIKFAPSTFLNECEWESHGQYDSLQFVNPNVKVLSVQFTKVGEKTYKAFPNLEWIIVRQHGFDNVNLAECEKRGIGVVNTKPFAQSTADWISQYIEESDRIAFVGYGAIARKVKTTDYIEVVGRHSNISDEVNTLVVSVPPENNERLIGDSVFSKFRGKLISVSRASVIDNHALMKNIKRISHAYIDTLDSYFREELLATGKVTYTKHTAFDYGFSYENNTKYFADLETIIKQCLDNKVDNPILTRKERVTF
jgi:phosphoglycerate dehydrogenase-like enzyme